VVNINDGTLEHITDTDEEGEDDLANAWSFALDLEKDEGKGDKVDLSEKQRESSQAEPPANTSPDSIWKNPVDGSELVLIPGGEFMMGSPDGEGRNDEHPQHRVRVDSFYLGKYEVTNAQWKRFVEANPEWRQDGAKAKELANEGDGYLAHWNGDAPPAGEENHPVVYVSWYAAVAYCEWAGLRLPTEAEWEYAAQGGRGYEYGTATGKLSKELANYLEGDTTPVGKYPPNPFGIYDLSGNAWECCSSEYRSYPYRADGGQEDLQTNVLRVVRGGSWLSRASLIDYTRARARASGVPGPTQTDVGLRCARAPRP
jgi:formylglycine-generating enzyme required for sulfatase activity